MKISLRSKLLCLQQRNKGLYKKHTYQLHAGAKGLVVTTFFRNENKVGRKISLDDYWKPSGKAERSTMLGGWML